MMGGRGEKFPSPLLSGVFCKCPGGLFHIIDSCQVSPGARIYSGLCNNVKNVCPQAGKGKGTRGQGGKLVNATF